MAQNERRRGNRPDRNRAKPKKTAPPVVYTPAPAFNRSRFVLNVLTIVAIAFAIFLGLSIFFNVKQITVSGAERYSEWTIAEVSGIEEGDSLLFFGQASASSKIIDALPYVKSVRFEIKLPGTVHIIIEEAPVAYAVMADNGAWWLMTAQGRLTEQVNEAVAGNCAQIQGVLLRDPVAGENAVAVETGEGSVTGADRLSAALLILEQMEANELFDKVSVVDVSRLQTLEFWYGTRYRVKLGDGNNMKEKLAAVKAAIDSASQYQTGILDASSVTGENLDKVTIPCIPFQN